MTAPVFKAPPSAAPAARSVTDFPELATKAVEFLCQQLSAFAMTAQEAACVVAEMRPVYFAADKVLFSVGDTSNTGYMLLVLDGNVAVDTGTVGDRPKVDISVQGPGALLGELALIDGAPRSANCTAVSAVTAAGLTATGLQRLVQRHPQVAAKLAIYIAQNTAQRLRALSEQLQMYDQLTNSMQREIDQLRATVAQGA